MREHSRAGAMLASDWRSNRSCKVVLLGGLLGVLMLLYVNRATLLIENGLESTQHLRDEGFIGSLDTDLNHDDTVNDIIISSATRSTRRPPPTTFPNRKTNSPESSPPDSPTVPITPKPTSVSPTSPRVTKSPSPSPTFQPSNIVGEEFRDNEELPEQLVVETMKAASEHYEFVEIPENLTLSEFATPYMLAANVSLTKILECTTLLENYKSSAMSCERELANFSAYPAFMESRWRNPNHFKFRGRNATILQDTDWGGTCNKLEILAGAIFRMNNNSKEAESDRHVLALGPIFSQVAWELDPLFLSRDFPVLLDCTSCDGEFDRTYAVVCPTAVVNGTVLDIRSDGLFYVANRYWAVDVYWNNGPSVMGFQQALAFTLIPKESVRRNVEFAMRKLATRKILGIHRRGMDNLCYQWIGSGGGEYECHPDGEIIDQINRLVTVQVGEKIKANFSFSTIESKHPLLMTCNYTLDGSQRTILKTAWPELGSFIKRRAKLNLFLSSDASDQNGDEHLANSFLFKKSARIADLTNDANCSTSRHRNMLYDMWGLTVSDYHMGNPVSSCDVIVVHWRKLMGKPIDSSFPPLCYNGYYRQRIKLV